MSNIRTYEITHSEPKPFPIRQKDSTDNLLGGSLVMRNEKIDKVLFDGGYAQASAVSNTTKDKFAFNFYNQDHLGNIRQVTQDYNGISNGKVIQTMNYYPFGAEFCDNRAKSFVQNHKYNGKEFDHMHGLNTYDYGARQYNPVTGRWDRMDPLCEDYYRTSPYAYCDNNPVNAIDPDGKAPWLVGALSGGGTDYALQVGENLLDGKGWNSFIDVDGKSILISAGQGACGMGFSKVKSVCKVGGKLLSKVSDAAFGAISEANSAQKDNEEMSASTYVKGALKGVMDSFVSGKMSSKLTTRNKTLKSLKEDADTKSRISRRPGISEKAKKMKEAKRLRRKASEYQKKTEIKNDVISGAAVSSFRKVPDRILKKQDE